MSLSAQNVIDSCSKDIRSVLSNSGADATVILDWVDRTHKDCLHTSIYAPFGHGSTTVTTVAGTSSYTLSPSDVRRILQVYDRTFNREIAPYAMISAPNPSGTGVLPAAGAPAEEQTRPRVMAYAKTQTLYTGYFRFIAPTTFVIFPAPSTTWAGTLEVYYEKQIATLASTATVLTIPEDGKDLMVAGVNFLANLFLKRGEEAQMWAATYQQLKAGIANS